MTRRRASLAVLAATAALVACTAPPPRSQHVGFLADSTVSGPTPVAIVPSPAPTPAAEDFAGQASAGDAFELAAAQSALQRAARPEVKSFAATVLRDHAQSAMDLKAAATFSGQALSPTASLTPEQSQALSDLARAPPQDFDRTYVEGQVKAHLQALGLLEDYAQNGDNPSLKAFASLSAPVVLHHYMLAASLQSALQ